MIHILRALAALAALAPLAAQTTCPCRQSSSPFIGSMPAMSVRCTSSMHAGVPYFKRSGFRHAVPVAWISTWHGSSFEPTALFGTADPPDIDAMSVGLDLVEGYVSVTTRDYGVIEMYDDQWIAPVFSVTDASRGQLGSVIRAEANDKARGNTVGGDLFVRSLPGSDICDRAVCATMDDATERLHDSREINLHRNNCELDGLDFYIPLLRDAVLHDLSCYTAWRSDCLLPNGENPRFFFTLRGDAANLAKAPSGWWKRPERSGATILQTTWNPATRSWSAPEPYLHFDQLQRRGGNKLLQSDDIDALAIDLYSDPPRIAFSLRGKPLADQLLFAAIQGSPPYAFVTHKFRGAPESDDLPITDLLGLVEADDVDAICYTDPVNAPRPATQTRAARGRHYGRYVTAVPCDSTCPPVFPYPETLAAGGLIHYWGSRPNIRLQTSMVGWPGGRADGVALPVWTFHLASSSVTVIDPFFLQARDARGPCTTSVPPVAPFCGDGTDSEGYPLPYADAKTLGIAKVQMQWIAADAKLTAIVASYPVCVTIR